MRAMVLREISKIRTDEDSSMPLELVELPVPSPGPKEILGRVLTCGICHTEIDEIEGRRKPKLPAILGHEVVMRIEKVGAQVSKLKVGQRVGVGWIYSSCGKCQHCRCGQENLCSQFQGTGCDADGGYAEYMVVSEDFAYLIPDGFTDAEAAPLLCAGAIGWRSIKLAGIEDGKNIGLYGFGASGHIVLQIIKHKFPNSKVFVFTKNRGDAPSQLAKERGADWVGITGDIPPEKLNCAIDTTPQGVVIKEALKNLEKGGRLVINVIRKESPVAELDYTEHLWWEKEIKSVANITRKDLQEFLSLADKIPIKPKIVEFKLEDANRAIKLLKAGGYHGAGVLRIAS